MRGRQGGRRLAKGMGEEEVRTPGLFPVGRETKE